jgi:hypothetical protein
MTLIPLYTAIPLYETQKATAFSSFLLAADSTRAAFAADGVDSI